MTRGSEETSCFVNLAEEEEEENWKMQQANTNFRWKREERRDR